MSAVSLLLLVLPLLKLYERPNYPLVQYLEEGILERNPFATIDADGVGELMRIAVEKGRSTREGLNAGICGEHGGDPESIALCRRLDLDYVSCSPPRVPVARLAAAQAAITEPLG